MVLRNITLLHNFFNFSQISYTFLFFFIQFIIFIYLIGIYADNFFVTLVKLYSYRSQFFILRIQYFKFLKLLQVKNYFIFTSQELFYFELFNIFIIFSRSLKSKIISKYKVCGQHE